MEKEVESYVVAKQANVIMSVKTVIEAKTSTTSKKCQK
jgi:hypothetical protein